MKLIVCPKCSDIFRLYPEEEPRLCRCGKSGGRYLRDGLSAEIQGEAIPLGFDNRSFVQALRNRPEEGWGERFEAFVIAKRCDTIRTSGI